MKIVLDIPKEFEDDYREDRFKDCFDRFIADIHYGMVCGNYERETAEMFIKVFSESLELQSQIPKWHYVADGDLPNYQEIGDEDLSETVIIATDKDIVTDAFYCFSENKWYKQGNVFLLGNVIAWMELPKFESEGRE